MLTELEKYTTVLPDSTLAPDSTLSSDSSSAVVNTALVSHILANTSAFYEFEVSAVPLVECCRVLAWLRAESGFWPSTLGLGMCFTPVVIGVDTSTA